MTCKPMHYRSFPIFSLSRQRVRIIWKSKSHSAQPLHYPPSKRPLMNFVHKTPDSVDKNWFDTVLSTEMALFMDKIK